MENCDSIYWATVLLGIFWAQYARIIVDDASPFFSARREKTEERQSEIRSRRVQSSWNWTSFSFSRFCHIARLFNVHISITFLASVVLLSSPFSVARANVTWWRWQWWWWWWKWCSIRRPQRHGTQFHFVRRNKLLFFLPFAPRERERETECVSEYNIRNRSSEYLNTCTRDGETMAGQSAITFIQIYALAHKLTHSLRGKSEEERSDSERVSANEQTMRKE